MMLREGGAKTMIDLIGGDVQAGVGVCGGKPKS